MFRKLVHASTVLFVVFGLFAVAMPAYALGNKRALKGTIVAIDTHTKTMQVLNKSGKSINLKVVKTTKITRNGKSGKFGKLRVGDKVNLSYYTQNNETSEIDDTPDNYDIHGTVESVDTTANTIVIASEEGGNSVTLNVDLNTVIERNGAAATLADLLVGDKVEAEYDSATMLASSIQADVEDSEIQGTISAIDTAANTVTVTPQDGSADVVLNVTLSTVIISDDTVVNLTDLLVGDQIEAEYDSATMIASKIDAENSNDNSNSNP